MLCNKNGIQLSGIAFNVNLLSNIFFVVSCRNTVAVGLLFRKSSEWVHCNCKLREKKDYFSVRNSATCVRETMNIYSFVSNGRI